MGNIKYIFKILFVMQIFAFTLATYGHPDAETIDFGTDPSRDQQIIEAAIRRGMDGEAVEELLRTKEAVVKVVTSPNGVTKTTTYKLEPDGSISSKTITERRNSYTYTSGNIPDDLRNSPDGTVTRTFTDENGHKVTQTIGVSKPKPSTVLGTDDLTGDWFNKPFPSWNPEPASPSLHKSVTQTFTGPNGERRTVQSWSSDPDFSEPESTITSTLDKPATNYHRTVTRTYTGPNGEKRVVQTTSSDPNDFESTPVNKPKFTSFGSDNWPGFSNFPSFSQPWGSTDTDTDNDSDDEWHVVEGNPDVEATTKKRFESWTPKTWDWPVFPTYPTTSTTTVKPKIHIEPELTNRAPLPNLDDFLKSQYGPTTTTSKTQTPTTVISKSTTTPKTLPNYPKLPTTTTQKPIRINVEDLPVAEILHNGKPANDDILKQLPPHLKPKIENVLNTDRVINIEHKHPIEDDVDIFSPKVETNIRKFTATHSGPEKPSIKDLDPAMQEILKNAGISPDDITNIDGDTITKTRTEPDGRKITTTYTVRTKPPSVHSTYKESTPVVHTSYHESTPHTATHTYTPYKPMDLPRVPPLTPLSAHFSPISEFLAKLGLTKSDISTKNGQLTKTFTDENGQILTATFVLSSPMSKRSVPAMKAKPLK